jgi:spore coat protein E
MTNYREIVTKAVISKGKKLFTTTHSIAVDNPSTILGCWVINHNFNGSINGNQIILDGSYDVNIWYSNNNDTGTQVVTQTNNYHEVINMRERDDVSGEDIIVRSLKQPSCVKAEIDGNSISYTIEKELGIELVGDIKVKIEASLDEDPWDEIEDTNIDTNKDVNNDSKDDNSGTSEIDNVNENFIEDTI